MIRERVCARAHLIRAALERSGDGDKFDEVVSDLEAGRCLYFEGVKSALIVQVIHDAEGTSFNAWLAAGDLQEIKTLAQGAEALARGLGCKFTSFVGGRKGWARVLASLGYAWNGQEFRKEL